jgi:hypothetical protein
MSATERGWPRSLQDFRAYPDHGNNPTISPGKIEDAAIVRAVIQGEDGIKLQVDVVGLDLTALIDTRQVVE